MLVPLSKVRCNLFVYLSVFSLFSISYSYLQKPGEELHFTIGECLSVICSGYNSSAAVDALIPARPSSAISTRSLMIKARRLSNQSDEPLKSLLQLILQVLPTISALSHSSIHGIIQEHLFSDRADTRSSAALWLISLVKHCFSHPLLIRNLAPIQRAFSALLGDGTMIWLSILLSPISSS